VFVVATVALIVNGMEPVEHAMEVMVTILTPMASAVVLWGAPLV